MIKPCKKCGGTDFYNWKRRRCRTCNIERLRKLREEGYYLRYQQNNREYFRNYQNNFYTPEKHRMRNGINAKRVRQATLNTSENRRKIKEFYANKPEGMEVDHIYPIKGKTCSGLHVWWNLQYLPISENRSKSNKISEQYQSHPPKST